MLNCWCITWPAGFKRLMHSTGKFVRANFMSMLSHQTVYNVALVSSSNISTSFPFNRENFEAVLTSADLLQVQYKWRVYRNFPISVSPGYSQSGFRNRYFQQWPPKLKEAKLVYVYALNAYRESRGIAPFILQLSDQHHAPVPIEQKDGWAPEPIPTIWRKVSCPYRNSNCGSSSP